MKNKGCPKTKGVQKHRVITVRYMEASLTWKRVRRLSRGVGPHVMRAVARCSTRPFTSCRLGLYSISQPHTSNWGRPGRDKFYKAKKINLVFRATVGSALFFCFFLKNWNLNYKDPNEKNSIFVKKSRVGLPETQEFFFRPKMHT